MKEIRLQLIETKTNRILEGWAEWPADQPDDRFDIKAVIPDAYEVWRETKIGNLVFTETHIEIRMDEGFEIKPEK